MPPVRCLTAILAADVAGYSRLMGADEEGTHERLKAHLRELIEPKIAEHRGRIRATASWLRLRACSTLSGAPPRYRAWPPRTAAGLAHAFSKMSGHPCQSARKKDPGSACKRDPSAALGQACPGSEQEGPARAAQGPDERRSGAREVPVCPPGASRGGTQPRFLKRQLSLPVSMISQ